MINHLEIQLKVLWGIVENLDRGRLEALLNEMVETVPGGTR